jgi:predicted nucleic acid-binding protein
MGNIIWKEYTIHKRIDRQEALKIIKIFKDALSLMENLAINCNEEEILKIADDLKITFYDAAYICYAKSRGIPLITEDRKLMEKAEKHVKILKFEDII